MEALWTGLSAHTAHSFFQSWIWLRTWLECLDSSHELRLLRVLDDEHVVAAALLTRASLQRHGVIPVRTWLLTATGDDSIDGITIEYNDLLALPDYYDRAWQAIAVHFQTYSDEWDEVRLDGVPMSALESWQSTGLPLAESRRAPSRFVRLADVRKCQSHSVVELLASRVRTRVRHTISGLESRFGPLTLQVATTPTESRQFFDELMLLHRARWDSSRSASTFCSGFSKDFHGRLIERALALGSIQLLRLCAGQNIVGLLYNFVYAGKIYFYQSGIDYETSQPNESPGLLLHARAIDFNARLGHELYDFLAGDSQYKRSLAKHSNELSWATVQAPRIRLRLESSLKRHYRRIRYRALEPR